METREPYNPETQDNSSDSWSESNPITLGAVAMALIALAFLALVFLQSLYRKALHRKTVLDSQEKRYDELIKRKTELNARLNRYIEWASGGIRFILVAGLLAINYGVGYRILGIEASNISEYLALNGAVAGIITLVSFVIFGSFTRLNEMLEEIPELVKPILVKPKFRGLDKDIDRLMKEAEKVKEKQVKNNEILSTYRPYVSE